MMADPAIAALKRPAHGGFPDTAASPPAREKGCPCEACGHPVEVGHVVQVYDDVGEIHADCDNPYSLTPDLDEDSPKPCILLGNPMLLYPVSELRK